MPPTHTRSRRRPAWGKIVALGILFLAFFLAWRYTPLAEVITAEHVVAWARSAGKSPWAPLLVVALYTPAAFLMFPRPLLTLFAVIAFGQWRGFAFSLAGIVLSALATYLVGRSLPEKTVHRIAGRNLERTTEAIRRRGLMSVFAVSVAPVAPFPVVGMVAGTVRIKLWHYVAGTVLGMLPGTIATTVFARQIEAALENPSHINYWVVAAVLGILILLVLAVRRWMLTLQHHA
ncbi:MAG TPA: VTT domain-containing protein [Burkholderiales bacterium]|nr:VTT domain-containing protein [Burkholderiales bacterium]